ncbi:MAG: nuclear transport factor 2 family protein [Gammaproteobacteria bacterium]|nr:nuclear transport factor 2 family protein [Gammaproteobacteria bacterium]
MRLKKIIISLWSVTLLSACASNQPVEQGYVELYLAALERSPGAVIENETASARFATLFADFKQENLEKIIASVYADQLYFNDTFRTFSNRSELSEYLVETAETVDSTTVEIEDVARSGSDYYLRWIMNLEVTVSGDKIATRSIGVTHLKFNDEGKIILHQDYWDGVDGFYQHLPIVGYLIRKVKARI